MGCWSREDNQVRTVAPAKAVDEAVYLQYACKHYGPKTGSKRKDVLIDLEMTVPRGTIYGLLGASGCGKTTLLSCVVGRRHLTSGEIWVLGGKPGTPGSGVPGPRIGYMPQEIALVGEFTVQEAVFYFASICGMPKNQMKERFRFLSNLLELPPDNRYVKNCSGGQQRRVSFAAAMVHDPELLILDEPTVGLDPVLRDKIWEHLVEIVVSKNIAVIITTHYIEETRQAHSIGLMRNGKLLAEESPDYLMTLFKKETLEDVFLVLSEKQNKGEPVLEFESDEHLAHKNNKSNPFDVKPNSASENNLNEKVDAGCQTYQQIEVHNLRRSRLRALLNKNVTQILRNPAGIFFTLFFPVLQIVTFFTAVGGDPRNLKVAIVNEESNWTECSKYISYYPTVKYTEYNHSCNMNMLSCRFLNELNDTVAEKVYYSDLDSGLEAVRKGKVVGVLYFADNFTEASVAVRDYGRRARDIDLNNSQVTVWMDMSNRQIGTILSYNLLDRYIEYSKRILKDCHDIPKLGDIPVRIEEPVYGKRHERFTVFMSPGVVLTMIFFLATLITSTIIIGDRLEGIWDRTLVAGVTAGDVMFTHIITQLVIVLIQAAEIVFATLYIFNVECRGSVITVVSLILLQGLAGMCYGFLISVVCSTYIMACYASTGSFYPMILICGVVWPLEGMPKVLQIISKFMPFTLPIFSLRNIMAKGWDITNVQVYDGFLVTIAWIIIFCVISYFGIKKSI